MLTMFLDISMRTHGLDLVSSNDSSLGFGPSFRRNPGAFRTGIVVECGCGGLGFDFWGTRGYESRSKKKLGITMSEVVARTGRHRQRYDKDNNRLVAGCIPFRLKENIEDHTGDLEDRLEVLMISSPKYDDYVFPKGGWEDDENVYEAACREALEEAGVRGMLVENELGNWRFRSKSKQDSCSLEGFCKGYMFPLKVTEELDSWPEQANRERKWLTVKDASKWCRYDWMREALENLSRVLSRDNQHQEMGVEKEAPESISEAAENTIFPSSCLMKASEPQGPNKLTVLG